MYIHSMKGKIINYIGLFMLLVVLPGMSWVYLSSGLSYQKAKRAELQRYGTVPAFPYVLMNGDTIGASELGGKLLLAFDPAAGPDAGADVALRELEKIHRQFDERRDVIFLCLGDPADSAALATLMEKYSLEDPGQVYTVVRPGTPNGDFGIRARGGDAATVAVADSAGIIRQYYDFRDGNRVRRSVEHIAILMPFRDRDEAVLRREKEK